MVTEGDKYLFELRWNIKSEYNLDEFSLRTLNQSLNDFLEELEFVNDYSNSQSAKRIETNFEFFNISSKLLINENIILISSKSIYDNIPMEEFDEILNPSDIVRLSGDPETLIKFTSANSMVNSFIYNTLERIINQIFGLSNPLQLMSTTLSTIQGVKQNADRL